MRDNFDECLRNTLRWEGGYVNHPRDPGGPTNYGITIATLSHELGRAATIQEVMHLTVEQAGRIYRKKFWNLVNGDDLPAGVDQMAFDIAVNSGPGRALKWLGETSREIVPAARVRLLDAKRVSFWKTLKIFATFGGGWMNREKDIFNKALAMARR